MDFKIDLPRVCLMGTMTASIIGFEDVSESVNLAALSVCISVLLLESTKSRARFLVLSGVLKMVDFVDKEVGGDNSISSLFWTKECGSAFKLIEDCMISNTVGSA